MKQIIAIPVCLLCGAVIGFMLGDMFGPGRGDAPVVEVGPVEQCPPCPDAGLGALPLNEGGLNVAERAINALGRCYSDLGHCESDRDRWQEQAEQCADEKLEIKR